jgi:hypothetical protein
LRTRNLAVSEGVGPAFEQIAVFLFAGRFQVAWVVGEGHVVGDVAHCTFKVPTVPALVHGTKRFHVLGRHTVTPFEIVRRFWTEIERGQFHGW